MDYYGPMVLLHSFRIAALTTVVAVTVHSAWAQKTGSETIDVIGKPQVASGSALDAELFYEIFLGELSTRTGDPGAGYAFMLEAARRSADGQLYQRAADIALQSRSGEHALAAAKAWKEALPESREANRYVLQILIALNRIGETSDLLRQELAQAPPPAPKPQRCLRCRRCMAVRVKKSSPQKWWSQPWWMNSHIQPLVP